MNTYREVTERVVEALESMNADEANWQAPWDEHARFPRNARTDRRYHGINVVLLWIRAFEKGWASNRWVSYRQAEKMGGYVKKGSSGTPVVYWNFMDVPVDHEDVSLEEYREMSEEEQADVDTESVPFSQTTHVFNVEQCGGLDLKEEPEWSSPIDQTIESWLEDLPIEIKHGGGQAAYDRRRDQVVVPNRATFESRDAYLSTVFHELVHATAPRLERDFGDRFGDDQYAMEELVAEIGSAFLCAEFQIPRRSQSTDYLKTWLDRMDEDVYATFTVAKSAEQAVDMLLGRDGD